MNLGFKVASYRMPLAEQPLSAMHKRYQIDIPSDEIKREVFGSGEVYITKAMTIDIGYRRQGGSLGRGDRRQAAEDSNDDIDAIVQSVTDPNFYDSENTGIRMVHYVGSDVLVDEPRRLIKRMRFELEVRYQNSI